MINQNKHTGSIDIGTMLVATGIIFLSFFIDKPHFIERCQEFALEGLFSLIDF